MHLPLAQKTCGLTAAKDIPVFVTEEMRKLYDATDQGQGSAVEAQRKSFKNRRKCSQRCLGCQISGFLSPIYNKRS